LSGCDFLTFSAPVESAWLHRLANESAIFIVGDGVTAKEYAHILRRNKCPFKVLATTSVLHDPSVCSDGFILLACPKSRLEVAHALDSIGLIKGKNYESFYRLLRNRAVFDFRGGVSFELEQWLRLCRELVRMPTLGGIDVLVNSNVLPTLIAIVGESFNRLKKELHIKLSIELLGEIDCSAIKSLELDLLEVIVREARVEYFNADRLNALLDNGEVESAHVVCIGNNTLFMSDKFSCERHESHPEYYDSLLFDCSYLSEYNKNNSGNCVSRRMFPIFDHNLKLKLCSLYNVPAQTDYFYSDIESAEYIKKRNELCTACRQKGLHR
jgi:hypothetical protein